MAALQELSRHPYRRLDPAGDWEAGQQRDAANPGLDADQDGEVFGDFEDVELGQQFLGQADPGTAAALTAMRAEAAAQRHDAARAAKKAAFDEAYDQGEALSM